MSTRVAIEGFTSQNRFELDPGNLKAIYGGSVGFFMMEKDKPETLQLHDEIAQVWHPYTDVAFLRSANGPVDGKKRMYKPLIYTLDGNDNASVVSLGEKVKISYIGGDIHNPLVEGAVESTSVVAQVTDLLVDFGKNLDQQVERYESEKYVYLATNDGEGGLGFTITGKQAKDGSGGTSSVTVKISGKDATTGNLTLQVSGSVTLQQVDSDGNEIQAIAMVGNGDGMTVIRDKRGNILQIGKNGAQVQSEATKELNYMVLGDQLKTLLTNILTTIQQITVPTAVGPSGPPANSAAFQQIAQKLDQMLAK